MKLYFIFTVCLVGTSFGNSLAQKQQVTLNLKNVSLYELFNQIKEQTGLRFCIMQNNWMAWLMSVYKRRMKR